jgi:predicted RNase H-like nuclease (RuvC/YqgF family)
MHGSVIHISSRRNVSPSGVIRIITRFGRPLIVAVDVEPAPRSIERMASSLGSMMFVPEKSISTREKSAIVKNFVKDYEKESGIKIKFRSRHEKDAFAAAVKAWRRNRYLIKKVDDALSKEGLIHVFDDVMRLILRGESENITNAINKILKDGR